MVCGEIMTNPDLDRLLEMAQFNDGGGVDETLNSAIEIIEYKSLKSKLDQELSLAKTDHQVVQRLKDEIKNRVCKLDQEQLILERQTRRQVGLYIISDQARICNRMKQMLDILQSILQEIKE